MRVLRFDDTRDRWVAVAFLAALAAIFVALGLAGSGGSTDEAGLAKLRTASPIVKVRMPHFTPKKLSARLTQARAYAGKAATGGGGHDGGKGDVFNNDVFGLPQNEESVTACKTDPDIVLSGTNDYRGLIDLEGNFTGWHFSTDGGRSLKNEGLLPPVKLLSNPSRQQPSGGDPVDVAGTTNTAGTGPGCAYLYASSLAYDPADPFGEANGIALYRSTAAILATCETEYPNNANPECWPTGRLVAENNTNHFLDKEWFDVGISGGQEWVWVTYSDFALDNSPEGFSGAQIFAVRCDRNLVTCGAPILISGDDGDVQFSDVTIAPDGRVYITWAQILGELPSDIEHYPEQTFVVKMRVAEPGATVFGPERVVHVEDKAIPFGGFLHSNEFRIATYPKSDVAIVRGKPRAFVVWDACKYRPLASICEEPLIKLKYSDDFGATWSSVIELSKGGDNYFPTIVSNDNKRDPTLVFAWFTNRYDRDFHNRQDVEWTTLDPAHPRDVRSPRRITNPSNEPEADPLLGARFIGDYIEVFATGDRAWVAYNANYRHEKLLGPFGVEGIPVPQQDNYLVRVKLKD